jgi:hypothetical protein
MAQQWPEPISDVTLGKALKRIHFTHPKRPTAIAFTHPKRPTAIANGIHRVHWSHNRACLLLL